MSPLAGPLFAAAALLAVAGGAKLVAPGPTRVSLRAAGLPSTAIAARALGVAEVGIAAYALGWGGRPAAALVAVAYLGFAAFAELVRRRTRGRAPCGCFGSSDAPLTLLHVGVDLALAAVAAAAAVARVPGLVEVAGETPLGGVPFVAYAALLAWLLQVTLTALPTLQAAVHPPRRALR